MMFIGSAQAGNTTHRFRHLALACAVTVASCLVGCGGGSGLVLDYTSQAVPVMRTITHSGATVADVVADLKRNPADEGLRALVQPYLAPMSCLLTGAALDQGTPRAWRDLQVELTTTGGADASARPAWRDLLDEGRYRVCYDAEGARLFVPGVDTGAAFDEAWPLLRYPVRFLRDSGRSRCATIEVFAYDNEYAALSLSVGSRPHKVDPSLIDAALPGMAPLNLEALDDFMRTGTRPAAIEVDEASKLYLYGREGETGTLAGSNMTLADLAVAYRAVFWCGDNEPYISLDQNEDNRFAKVNFGGLLADTRIGQVTLDADRYFKTISTGLNPFNGQDLSGPIRAQVDGFSPGSVKDLTTEAAGRSSYRFWFYPDSLRVVTDGSIGAVESPRFLADIERQDGPKRISRGQRESIDDLNGRYDAYSRAVPTYAELDNVGRLLALMTWLRETKADTRVDLASLLSVELPPWRTERATGKILAVNCYTGPESMLDERNPGFLPRTKVFDFSARLSQCKPTITEDQLLEFGSTCFDQLPRSAYTHAGEHEANQRLDAIKVEIDRQERALKKMSDDIDRTHVDHYSQPSVDAYNAKVERYEAARQAFNGEVERYNSLADQANAAGTVTQMYVSIGGGIDLALRRAPVVRRAPTAPAVRAIASARASFSTAGKVQASGGWIRSRP